MSATYTSFCLNYVNIVNQYQNNMSTMLRTLNNMNARLQTGYYTNNTNNNLYRRNVNNNNVRFNVTGVNRENVNNNFNNNNINNNNLENIFNPFINLLNSFSPITSSNRGLTQRQIEDNTEILLYRDTSSNETICPISLVNFRENDNVLRINRCRHIFSPESLRIWLRTSTICPVCRYNILEHNNSTSLPVTQQQMNINPQTPSTNTTTNTIHNDPNNINFLNTNINNELHNILTPENGWRRYGDMFARSFTIPLTTTVTNNNETTHTERSNENDESISVETNSSDYF